MKEQASKRKQKRLNGRKITSIYEEPGVHVDRARGASTVVKFPPGMFLIILRFCDLEAGVYSERYSSSWLFTQGEETNAVTTYMGDKALPEKRQNEIKRD